MKKYSVSIMVLLLVLLLTGCNTSYSYIFNVSTGDKIKVTLDTTDGYKLEQENGSFSVKKDDELITKGTFFTEEEVDEYFELVPNSDEVTFINEGTYEGSEYVFYLYEGTWYHVIRINDSKTGIGLVNKVSESAAQEAFELLKFEVLK